MKLKSRAARNIWEVYLTDEISRKSIKCFMGTQLTSLNLPVFNVYFTLNLFSSLSDFYQFMAMLEKSGCNNESSRNCLNSFCKMRKKEHLNYVSVKDSQDSYYL